MDGIRFLDPSTSRMLKIYPLDTVTRWDVSVDCCTYTWVFNASYGLSENLWAYFVNQVLDSLIFAFWAKTSVDPEPRRIRLKSNSYTTSNILDTVTAASIQVGRFAISYYFSLWLRSLQILQFLCMIVTLIDY